MELSRLNVFQRLTRQWDSLHPYNAAQAMRLAGRADRDRLADAWRSTLLELGLDGAVHCDGRRFRWQPVSNRAAQKDFIQIEPGISLDQLMSRELNRPFDGPGVELPFRPFVLDAGNDSYCAGVVYHHWVADSHSIRVLLREWFLRMHDPSAASRALLRIATEGYWPLFGPDRAKWNVGGAVLEMFRWSARFRRARRIDPDGFRDLSVHFTHHRAPPGLIGDVVRAARRRGVKVNDLCLAAMARVCDELVPVRTTPRRKDLALGTIVDMRSKAPQRLEAFGLYLGFTSIFCRPEDLRDDEHLLRRIHEQNASQKRTAAAESSMVRMLAGLVAASLLNRRKLLEFYRKRLALAGGISNVNLNRDWPAEYHPAPLLDYLRISPAGPMMPVVFTPTTIGDDFNFGLTCRESVIPRAHASALAAEFISCLRHLASS